MSDTLVWKMSSFWSNHVPIVLVAGYTTSRRAEDLSHLLNKAEIVNKFCNWRVD